MLPNWLERKFLNITFLGEEGVDSELDEMRALLENASESEEESPC
jgi:hypothetical protein